MAHNKKSITISLLLASIAITSCDLSPDHKNPEMEIPNEFKWVNADDKSQITDGSWKVLEYSQSTDKGNWWKIFNDEKLNELEKQAFENNHELEAAIQRTEQARALSDRARAGFFPSLSIGASPSRYQQSNYALGLAPSANQVEKTSYRADATLAYELDLFGRVRNSYRSADFNSEAAEDALKSVLLSLQADVASNYFAIKTADTERKLISDVIKVREEAERILKRRFELGDIGEQDYMRAVSELASARADLISVEKSRAELENALAVLVGENPSSFKIKDLSLTENPPQIPSGLPSALLERRPDIQEAANMMASANANIGVARAAFFPSINLTASGGYESGELDQLFDWSSRSWALGPLFGTMVSLPIFEGGKNIANLDMANAGYKESVANYRQKVLVAFKDVENSLVAIQKLSEQAEQQKIASDSVQKAAKISKLRYDSGYVNYLEVVDSERSSLAMQRALVQIQGARYAATISLIRALGGGFELPSAEKQNMEEILKPVVN